MKKNILAILSIFGLMMTSSVSQALYIEPYVGAIVSGSGDLTALGSTTEFDVSGNGMGLKLGWSLAGLAFGVDYQSTSAKTEVTGATAQDVKVTNIGAFVDFDPPVIPFHVYGTYIMKSTADDDTSTDANGSGLKVGVGFTGLPFVAINLDYTTLKYDESTPAAAAPFEQNVKVMMASVSLPLNL